MDINVGDVLKLKKQHPCGQQRMGSTPGGSRFPAEMSGLRSPDYDRTEITRKKCERNR